MRHLGGHANITHIDEGSLKLLQGQFDVKTLIDIGCGPGGQVRVAKSLGIKSVGIDGDQTLIDGNKDIDFKICDFTLCSYTAGSYDLAWSCEFLEHVDERYIKNYMPTFSLAKMCLITFAPEGKGGYHHVNCKNEEYWKGVFAAYGFAYNDDVTQKIRTQSTMRREFVRKHGLFFESLR